MVLFEYGIIPGMSYHSDAFLAYKSRTQNVENRLDWLIGLIDWSIEWLIDWCGLIISSYQVVYDDTTTFIPEN